MAEPGFHMFSELPQFSLRFHYKEIEVLTHTLTLLRRGYHLH